MAVRPWLHLNGNSKICKWTLLFMIFYRQQETMLDGKSYVKSLYGLTPGSECFLWSPIGIMQSPFKSRSYKAENIPWDIFFKGGEFMGGIYRGTGMGFRDFFVTKRVSTPHYRSRKISLPPPHFKIQKKVLSLLFNNQIKSMPLPPPFNFKIRPEPPEF